MTCVDVLVVVVVVILTVAVAVVTPRGWVAEVERHQDFARGSQESLGCESSGAAPRHRCDRTNRRYSGHYSRYRFGSIHSRV